MDRLQRLTHEYAVAVCDTPTDVDQYGLLLHRECGCPKMLTDWYYEVMGN